MRRGGGAWGKGRVEGGKEENTRTRLVPQQQKKKKNKKKNRKEWILDE